MRATRIVKAAAAALVLAASPLATAGSMDPALERLVVTPAGGNVSCTNNGQYRPGEPSCVFDNAAFKKLVNQYGFALAPLAMNPARTTGLGGFQIALEGAFTSIDSSADYWQNGTRGPIDPNTGQSSIKNTSPDSWLQFYNLSVRKGLPFGFELGVNIGYLMHTSIVSGGADVRWALLEGFRSGVLGVLPDLSIGAGVRTITGSPQMSLTAAAGQVVVSKPIPIADASVFTPYVGYQFLRIFADSGPVDATPSTDALGVCNYQGQREPGGFAGDDGTGPYTGQPVCGSGGSPEDFNNTSVFDKARITRHRIVLGMSYRYEIVVVGAELITDLVAPSSANHGAERQALDGVPRQSTIAVQLGAAF